MRLARLWGGVLAAALCACVHGSVGGSLDSEGKVRIGGSLHATTSEPSDADLAAADAADAIWSHVMSRCGGSYFALVKSPPAGDLRLTEYWNVTRVVRPEEVTVADSETGVVWTGYTKMKAAFQRSIGPDRTWSSWSSCGEIAEIPLRRVHEKWDVGLVEEALVEAGFAPSPDCSTLPPRPSSLPGSTRHVQ